MSHQADDTGVVANPAMKGGLITRHMMGVWLQRSTRLLPFADAASPDLPLPRLLRLALIQVSVGMSLTLLVGTLNRVMIVELRVPAGLVGVMLSLSLLFAPLRALVGHKSDNHVSALGLRRIPYIFRGTMVQFGGLALMPFALLVLAGSMQANMAPAWVGQSTAALAILLVGAGIHITQTVGLALATDLAPKQDQPNVVGLMYVMLLVGSIVSALAFGAFLADFTPGRLIQVIQGSALVTVVLNFVALWKQEPRVPRHLRAVQPPEPPAFGDSWNSYAAQKDAVPRLVAVGLGTLAFSMADILLEPYGGQVLGLGVGATTKLTATFAGGSLIGFTLASRILSRGGDPFRMAVYGAVVGIPALMMVIASASMQATGVFAFGVMLMGFGSGLFGHGTLTATMNYAPRDQIGMAMGAWGTVQATAAGLGAASAGIIRDVVGAKALPMPWPVAANGYIAVYMLEIGLLLATLLAAMPLMRKRKTE